MTLGELRTLFAQFSGRYDLVKEDGSNNGADFFINAGQRFLDRRIDFRKSNARLFKELAIDTWYLKVQNCRTIEKVWINDSEGRWELEKKDLIWLHEEFPDLISETDTGDPLYWSPAGIRGIDIKDTNNQGSFFNYVIAQSIAEDYVGIVLLPPPSVAVVVDIWGKFYTDPLSEDGSQSYWSSVVPETLLAAALYRLEIFYRNTEGAKDWLAAVDIDLRDIDKDTVQEDTANADQLEG
jgi:hypothetical protein